MEKWSKAVSFSPDSCYFKGKNGAVEMKKKKNFSYTVDGSKTVPDILLPVYFHSMGHVIRYYPYEEHELQVHDFLEVYWCISGSGRFFIDGSEPEIMKPGDFFYRLSFEVHHSEIVEEPWEYRWLTFYGPVAEAFFQAYGFPRKCIHAGPCPQELYIRLENLMREPEDWSYREAVAVIASILARAGGRCINRPPHTRGMLNEAKALCAQNYQDPTFDINTLASMMRTSRWTLRRLFQEHLHITPSRFLIDIRMNYAIYLLKETHLPVAEIGRRSGFTDPEYFYKVIRRYTGVQPSKLRQL